MATTSALPSSPAASSQTTTPAPPNFYAQAASAQPAAAKSTPGAEDTQKFRTAIEKLVTIFDRIEKLKPNGIDISKKIKSVAQSLKDLKSEVFEGEEGEGGDLDTDLGDGKTAAGQGGAASPPTPAPGGAPGTGAQ